MPPPNEKTNIKSKQSENKESKQKLFSFRWLLRKSKSSRFSRETQAEKCSSANVPASKSCDTGLTALETVDRCPTFLLWKLLPPPGKNSCVNKAHIKCTKNKLPFRSSFSCNDVHNLVPPSDLLPSAESTDALNSVNKLKQLGLKHPSQSCCKLHKSNIAFSHMDFCRKSPSLVDSQDLPPYPVVNVLCKLCLTLIPSSHMFMLEDCSCVFCISCLYQYMTINIREGNIPITCPDADCPVPGNILVSEIKEIAGEDSLVLFERYKQNIDVDLDPTRLWCPAVGCETICSFSPPSKPDVGTMVRCSNCRLKFCSLCKITWHGKTTCEEAKKALDNEEMELAIREDEQWIKRCPNCSIPIEKDEGCAQMMCYRCKHIFCWHCLTSLDEDFLLRHYDKGPCRNKLGHSRASMIWHRTQVVGIFAGFSFLLLIASPFLLLAAPCLLCCRCKNRFFYEEATPL